MEVVGDPDAEPEVCQAFQEVIDRHENRRYKLAKIERFAFYERAKKAFALIQSDERRLYGNVLLKMGVVRPD
jgi:L-fucose mutarotase